MLPIIRLRTALGFALVAVTFFSCSATTDYSPLLRAEPEIGGEFSRAPRTLRLYYNALPDVSQSTLTLVGPGGEHQLRGLHSMAADDLMVEIMDPVTSGDYTVQWTTVVGDDPSVYSGSFNFTVITN
jgi:methionine-rich copper-binding protein CopC